MRKNVRRVRQANASRQRSVYCTPLEWAAIRELAQAAGLPVSRYLVDCALQEPQPEKQAAGLFDHPLVLSEEEQRVLYERVAALERCSRVMLEKVPGTDISVFEIIAMLQDLPDAHR